MNLNLKKTQHVIVYPGNAVSTHEFLTSRYINDITDQKKRPEIKTAKLGEMHKKKVKK